MAENAVNRAYKVGDIIAKDINMIERKTRDLTAFCAVLSDLYAELKERGYIVEAFTADTLRAFELLEESAVIAGVERAFRKEADKFNFMATKRRFLQGIEESRHEIGALFNEARERAGNPLRGFVGADAAARLGLSPEWRLPFLIFKAGKWDFLADEVETEGTQTIATERAADLMNEARGLYDHLRRLSADIWRESGGEVNLLHLLSDKDNALIKIDTDNEIYFCPEFGVYL